MLMAKADTPTLQYRRRKSRLAIHAALFAIVNGFFVGQWLLVRDAPLEEVDPRVFASFWPVWLMLLWGVVLGIHGLYVWARKPIVEIQAARPVSWRFGRAVRTVVFTDIVGSTERARELGDRRWRDLLGRHNRLAEELARRFRGRVVKHLGDGQLAVFESPEEAIRFADSFRTSSAARISTSALGCTPVRSICSGGTWPGSACTSPHASWAKRTRPRSSCPEPCTTSWPVRTSPSWTWDPAGSEDSRENGSSSPSRRRESTYPSLLLLHANIG
jgi:hypothetical protein